MHGSIELVVIEENNESPILQLNQRLKTEVQEAYWLGRVWRGIKVIGLDKGSCAQTALIAATICGTVMLILSVGTSAVGSYKMFEEACLSLQRGEHFSSNIGHAGGWSAQVLLYPFMYFSELSSVTSEGDFHHAMTIYGEALRDGSPDHIEIIARHLHETLTELGPRCLIPKNLYKQLTIKRDLLTQRMEIQRLARITTLFENIHQEIKQTLSKRRYFHRNWEGIRYLGKEKGRLTQSAAVITGIVIPLILIFQCFLMLTGAIILSKDLITKEEPLDAIGHIGEWTPDAFGLVYMAKTLNDWSITSYGDLFQVSEIMRKHITPLKDDEDVSLYPKLIKAANEELKRVASRCMFNTIPSSYLLN